MIPCSVSNAGLNSDNSRNSLTSDNRTGIDGTFGSSIRHRSSSYQRDPAVQMRLVSWRGEFVMTYGYPPRSRSFQPLHALSRHCLASSGRCWESLTDARVCSASTLFWSVSRARSINRSQVFSAAGSKLPKPRIKHWSPPQSFSRFRITHQRSYDGSIHISAMLINTLTIVALTSASESESDPIARSFPLF